MANIYSTFANLTVGADFWIANEYRNRFASSLKLCDLHGKGSENGKKSQKLPASFLEISSITWCRHSHKFYLRIRRENFSSGPWKTVCSTFFLNLSQAKQLVRSKNFCSKQQEKTWKPNAKRKYNHNKWLWDKSKFTAKQLFISSLWFRHSLNLDTVFERDLRLNSMRKSF